MSSKDGDQSSLAAVQVAVRIRPLSEKDRVQPRFANATNDDVLQVHDNNTVLVTPPHNKSFIFDHVFGPHTRQCDIFSTLGEKAIHKFIEGYNVTMLAYGQTSSGKTYTMGTAQHKGRHDPEQNGIVPRAMALLFELLHQNDTTTTRPNSPATSLSSDGINNNTSKGRLRPLSRISYNNSSLLASLSPPQSSHSTTSSSSSSSSSITSSSLTSKYKYTVKVSFVEIYNEELIDLLNGASPNERPPITIREDSKGQIYWTGVKEMVVNSTEDVLMFLQQGTQNRATGATDMNEQSSRSHAVFSVSLRQEKFVPTNQASTSTSRATSPASPRVKARPLSTIGLRNINEDHTNEDGEWVITSSKFHFVDLAGSERLKRTAAEGDRRKEGISINGGLLALGNVISALGDPSKRSTHIPYRDSKLTRLLQDSLGGSAMTLMIACVSPMEYNINETLNTLQYANRARNIKNKMEKNEAEEWMTTDSIDLLRTMVMKLKNELRQQRDPEESQQQQQLVIADLKRQVEELLMEATVTRERNRMVENELQILRSNKNNNNNNRNSSCFGSDFEHLVEPVIEQYETSIASLESKLSMSRAALNHSDFRIEELQELTDQQTITIHDLQNQLKNLATNNEQQQQYIMELEGKLSHSVKDAVQDEELLTELKNRIMKFKEMDDNTEQYILNLEKQLAMNEHEYTKKVEKYQTTLEEQNEKMNQLKNNLHNLHHPHDNTTHSQNNNNKDDNKDNGINDLLKERDLLQKKVSQLEIEISTLNTKLGQQEQQQQQQQQLPLNNDNNIRRLSTHLERNSLEHQKQNDPSLKPITTSGNIDIDLEARKKMFSRDPAARRKSTLLQSTLASLENVQLEYVALKERYKHWSVKTDTHSPLPLTSLSPSSSSSATTATQLDIEASHALSLTSESSMADMIPIIKGKCDTVLQQYQNQLQRVHGAIQRVEKLESSLSSPLVNDSLEEENNAQLDYLQTLVELKEQLQERQHVLQEVCKSFEQDMDEDMKKMEIQYTTSLLSSPPPISSSSLVSNDSVSSTSSTSSSSTSSSSSLSSSGDALTTWKEKHQHQHQQQINDSIMNNEEMKKITDHMEQRLTNAMQDVDLNRSKLYVLQTKLQKLEVAVQTRQQRKASMSDDQDSIEQLLKKMDAMKMQLETRDANSVTIQEV